MIPPKASAAFVCAMENVLAVYAKPYDPKRPVVCADEGGTQLIGDAREPLPVRPTSPAEEDYEYERRGTASLLSTHKPSVLYKVFAPADARRLIDWLEFVHTPKHGSWLNMAEIELSVLARQCLDRRIPDTTTLRSEVAAWQVERNANTVRVDWQFTTSDARTKRKRLYPALEATNSGVAEH